MTYTVYEAMPLSQMLARVQKYYPGDGYKLVEKAYFFAQEAHKNQYRKSGEPYFTHPCFVASILVELSLDPPTIAAGLLHDTVEDCEGITLDTIRQEFGEEVAMLVADCQRKAQLEADRQAHTRQRPALEQQVQEADRTAAAQSARVQALEQQVLAKQKALPYPQRAQAQAALDLLEADRTALRAGMVSSDSQVL